MHCCGKELFAMLSVFCKIMSYFTEIYNDIAIKGQPEVHSPVVLVSKGASSSVLKKHSVLTPPPRPYFQVLDNFSRYPLEIDLSSRSSSPPSSFLSFSPLQIFIDHIPCSGSAPTKMMELFSVLLKS